MPPSKQVVDRRKDARAVAESVNTHTAVVRDGLATLLGPYLAPGETLPDFVLLLALLSRSVQARAEAMVTADNHHSTEIADDDGFRATRDTLAAALVENVTSLREALDGIYGSDAIHRYGIKGTTPRDPAQIAAFADAMAERLEADDLPTPRFAANLDRSTISAKLRADAAPLHAALDDVAREVREAEGTLVVRDDAVTVYERTFGRSATALAALYRLAGQDELASRIRPSGRRPGRLAEPGEPAVEPSEALPPEPGVPLEELPA